MRESRRGMTLLELTLAMSLMAVMVTAVGSVLRTAHTAWVVHEGDTKEILAAGATLRHVVRHIRQAEAVTDIQGSTVTGTLTVLMPSGDTLTWAHDVGQANVMFGTSTLGENIIEMGFTGYEADGVTITNTAADIHSVEIHIQVQLPSETGGTRDITCWAWLRSW